MTKDTVFVAFLRGINVGGHAAVPMKRLQDLCVSLGWGNVRTLLNSGNVVFSGAGSPAGLEDALEQALLKEFGLNIAVMVRSSSDLLASTTDAPFEMERTSEASKISVCFCKSVPNENAAETVAAYAKFGEIAVRSENILWIYFPSGMGRSRITPDILDRATGSATTCRNWNTVLKLLQLTHD